MGVTNLSTEVVSAIVISERHPQVRVWCGVRGRRGLPVTHAAASDGEEGSRRACPVCAPLRPPSPQDARAEGREHAVRSFRQPRGSSRSTPFGASGSCGRQERMAAQGTSPGFPARGPDVFVTGFSTAAWRRRRRRTTVSPLGRTLRAIVGEGREGKGARKKGGLRSRSLFA